jgi:hypothetical protein
MCNTSGYYKKWGRHGEKDLTRRVQDGTQHAAPIDVVKPVWDPRASQNPPIHVLPFGRIMRIRASFSFSFATAVFVSLNLDVYTNGAVHIERLVPPARIYHEAKSRICQREDLEFGEREQPNAAHDALEHEPSRLDDDEGLRYGIPFAAVFDFFLGDVDVASLQVRLETTGRERLEWSITSEKHESAHYCEKSMRFGPSMF